MGEELPHTMITQFTPLKISMPSARVKGKVNGEVKGRNGVKAKIIESAGYVAGKVTSAEIADQIKQLSYEQKA